MTQSCGFAAQLRYSLIFNGIQYGYRDGFLNQAKGQTSSFAPWLIASVAEKWLTIFQRRWLTVD